MRGVSDMPPYQHTRSCHMLTCQHAQTMPHACLELLANTLISQIKPFLLTLQHSSYLKLPPVIMIIKNEVECIQVRNQNPQCLNYFENTLASTANTILLPGSNIIGSSELNWIFKFDPKCGARVANILGDGDDWYAINRDVTHNPDNLTIPDLYYDARQMNKTFKSKSFHSV